MAQKAASSHRAAYATSIGPSDGADPTTVTDKKSENMHVRWQKLKLYINHWIYERHTKTERFIGCRGPGVAFRRVTADMK